MANTRSCFAPTALLIGQDLCSDWEVCSVGPGYTATCRGLHLILLTRALGCFLWAHGAATAQWPCIASQPVMSCAPWHLLRETSSWQPADASAFRQVRQVSHNSLCASFLLKWFQFYVKENASLLHGEVPNLVTCSKSEQLFLSNAPDVKVAWT